MLLLCYLSVVPSRFFVSVETDLDDHHGRCSLAALIGFAGGNHRLEQAPDDLEHLTLAAQPMAPKASTVEASPAPAA